MATRIVSLMILACCIATAQIPVTGCRDIYMAGTYTLTQDITTDRYSCFYIAAMGTVIFEGNGHTITSSNLYHQSFWVNGSSGTRIKNVTLRNPNPATTHQQRSAIQVQDAYNFVAHNVTVVDEAVISCKRCRYSAVLYSHVVGTVLFDSGQDNGAMNNTMSIDPAIPAAASSVLNLSQEARFVADNNVLDGGWIPSTPYRSQGTDNAVTVSDGSVDTMVSYNTIRNVWCTGVEYAGAVTRLKVENNDIRNYGASCVGGWWDASADGLTVKANTCAQTVRPNFNPFMFMLTWTPGISDHGQMIYFRDVTIEGNTLIPDPTNPPASRQLHIGFDSAANLGRFTGGNVRIAGNNFSHALNEAYLSPPYLFQDGGSNVCNFTWVGGSYQLSCQ